jgi:hypothetical protein
VGRVGRGLGALTVPLLADGRSGVRGYLVKEPVRQRLGRLAPKHARAGFERERQLLALNAAVG